LSLAAKVRASEELFRTIFEDAPIAIYLANLDDNKLVRVNKTYCEMLGYTAAELLAKTFIELGHPEDSPKNIQVAHSLEQGEINSYQIELRQIAATGKIVWVNVTATLIRDGEGKPLYQLGMIENITNRKISAAALQASES
ncbi:PAS domain S-box protein, partial [Microcoleus sp. HI-ES]|nr:PAS domain S-box protein [Microcoleus sp. HI-ES]